VIVWDPALWGVYVKLQDPEVSVHGLLVNVPQPDEVNDAVPVGVPWPVTVTVHVVAVPTVTEPGVQVTEVVEG
jgi:hypothetical protein